MAHPINIPSPMGVPEPLTSREKAEPVFTLVVQIFRMGIRLQASVQPPGVLPLEAEATQRVFRHQILVNLRSCAATNIPYWAPRSCRHRPVESEHTTKRLRFSTMPKIVEQSKGLGVRSGIGAPTPGS